MLEADAAVEMLFLHINISTNTPPEDSRRCPVHPTMLCETPETGASLYQTHSTASTAPSPFCFPALYTPDSATSFTASSGTS